MRPWRRINKNDLILTDLPPLLTYSPQSAKIRQTIGDLNLNPFPSWEGAGG